MDPIFLKITSEISAQNPTNVIIQLGGKLSTPEVARFRSEIQRLLQRGCRHIEIDMSELIYIDSMGIASLIPLYQWVRDNQGSLRILNPRRIIHHILVCAHINDIIEIGEAA